MPELHEGDLEEMFARLAADVSQRTAPPGAGRAIKQGRRRRTTTALAGAAAVAVLAAAGTAGVRMRDHDGPTYGDPLGPPTHRSGAALQLDAARLSEATKPWLTGWRLADSPVLSDPPCIKARGLPGPVGDHNDEFASGDAVGAAVTYVRFGSTADAQTAFTMLRDQLDACATDIKGQSVGDDPRAEVEIGSVPARSGNPSRTLWIAVIDRDVALLTVAGAGPPPSEVASAVGIALVDGTRSRTENLG